jgi:hypothetical protein
MLQLTTTGLMYRPFPKPPFTVRRADVAHIEADTRNDSVYQAPFYRITILTLWFNLKSEDDHRSIRHSIDRRPANFLLSTTELVQLISHIPRGSLATKHITGAYGLKVQGE